MAEQIKWHRVNEDPFEYAVQRGPHGDEFVKLLDGSCLRRAVKHAQRGNAQADALAALAECEEADISALLEQLNIDPTSTIDRRTVRSFRSQIVQLAAVSHTPAACDNRRDCPWKCSPDNPECLCADPRRDNPVTEIIDWKARAERAEAQVESARAQAIEECAHIAEQQAQEFLSTEYAANQPLGSFCERFACDEVAKAIRASLPSAVLKTEEPK